MLVGGKSGGELWILRRCGDFGVRRNSCHLGTDAVMLMSVTVPSYRRRVYLFLTPRSIPGKPQDQSGQQRRCRHFPFWRCCLVRGNLEFLDRGGNTQEDTAVASHL